MIEQAITKYQNINLDDSFMIGDSKVDIELAINMGIKGYGIGFGSEYMSPNVIELDSLSDLLNHI
jgi:D-glycero-D-manno-heptose 1,7-bisphosphate phosphatase